MYRVFKTTRGGNPYRQFAMTAATAQLAVSKEAERTLEGYAMLWNVNSLPDPYGELVRLMPNSALFDDPCLALYHHDFSAIIGTTENATLSVKPDEKGAKVLIKLPKTNLGDDLMSLVGDKYIRGMSFGMYGWSSTMKQESGVTVELMSKFRVDEVTVTPIPRFTQTSIAVVQPGQGFGHVERAKIILSRHRLRNHVGA